MEVKAPDCSTQWPSLQVSTISESEVYVHYNFHEHVLNNSSWSVIFLSKLFCMVSIATEGPARHCTGDGGPDCLSGPFGKPPQHDNSADFNMNDVVGEVTHSTGDTTYTGNDL